MFIAKTIVKGHTYYQVRESHWENGRDRYRTLIHLGTQSTIEGAFLDTEKRYFASRQGREKDLLTDADFKRWNKLQALLPWYRQNNTKFKLSTRFKAEQKRLARERTQAIPPDCQVVLDLPLDATPDQIQAAYRRKARECHPDHGGSDEAMAAVNEAYDRLMSE